MFKTVDGGQYRGTSLLENHLSCMFKTVDGGQYRGRNMQLK
jgi:hypothetical protein